MTEDNNESEKSPYARTPADVLKDAGYEDEAEAVESSLNSQKVSVLDKHRNKTR